MNEDEVRNLLARTKKKPPEVKSLKLEKKFALPPKSRERYQAWYSMFHRSSRTCDYCGANRMVVEDPEGKNICRICFIPEHV